MGSWTIHIAGHGIHDNNLDGDVDQLLVNFVAKLRAAGHQLEAVHLNVGSGRSLTQEPDGTDKYFHF